MRKRERERFLRMNYTEEELWIRNTLMKSKKYREQSRFKIVIYTERFNKYGQYVDRAGHKMQLLEFSDSPEEGRYLDTIWFNYPREFEAIIKLYEGQFYVLFNMATGERIGYGSLDPDSPVEEIREHFECCDVCELCFWRGMIWGEKKDVEIAGKSFCTCYHPDEREVWKQVIEQEGLSNGEI